MKDSPDIVLSVLPSLKISQKKFTNVHKLAKKGVIMTVPSRHFLQSDTFFISLINEDIL